MDRERSYIITAVLIIINFTVRSDGFLWNQQSIEQLFGNSDAVFNRVGQTIALDQQDCVADFKGFINGVRHGEQWAIRMLDSWGKMPNGLTSGNHFDFGHYDQCLLLTPESAETFNHQGQYCQLAMQEIAVPSVLFGSVNASFVIGLCVPVECSSGLVQLIMNEFMQNVGYRIDPARPGNFCTTGTTPNWGPLQWFLIIIAPITLAIVLFSTMYELYMNSTHQEMCGIFTSFSLYKNLENLLDIQPKKGDNLACLNGIRVISMAWFVMLSVFRYYNGLPAIMNRTEAQEYRESMGRLLEIHTDLAACTFFVVSGTLLAWGFVKTQKQNDQFNILRFYSHRLLRLAPLLFVVVLIIVALPGFVDNGPLWWTVDQNLVQQCQKYWWSSMLFIQNWINYGDWVCNAPTWYISVAVQLYIISPFILFFLSKRGSKGIVRVLTGVLLLVIGSTFAISLGYGFHFNYTTETYLQWITYPTWNWNPPWLIGLSLGYYLYDNLNSRIQLSSTVTVVLWILAPVVMILIMFLPLLGYRSDASYPLLFALYQSLYRPLWAASIAWVIFACVKDCGGIINWFLSFDIYQVFGRMCYSMCVIHYPLVVVTHGVQRMPEYFSVYLAFHEFVGIYGMSVIFGLMLMLMVERPVLNIERTIYRIIELWKEGRWAKNKSVKPV